MAKRSPEVLEQLRITNLTTGEKQFGSFGQGIPNVALPINATQATVSRTPDIIASVIPGMPTVAVCMHGAHASLVMYIRIHATTAIRVGAETLVAVERAN